MLNSSVLCDNASALNIIPWLGGYTHTIVPSSSFLSSECSPLWRIITLACRCLDKLEAHADHRDCLYTYHRHTSVSIQPCTDPDRSTSD